MLQTRGPWSGAVVHSQGGCLARADNLYRRMMLQCRYMIERNGSQGNSTNYGTMRTYKINSIAIRSVDDDNEYISDDQKVSDA